jgi:hypothetical protein
MIIFGRAAFAADCGEKIQAFNTYEDYDDNMQPDPGVSVFPVEEYSSNSSFEGVLVKASPGSKLGIAFFKALNKPASRTQTLDLEKSEHKKGYSQAVGFDHRKLFSGNEKHFTLSILKDGKAICEDGPHEIFSEGDGN